jgi:hypothetical protein
VLLPAAETELGGQSVQAVLPDAPATLLKVPFGHGTQASASKYEPGEQSANSPVMFNRAKPDLTPSQTSPSFGQTQSTRPLEAWHQGAEPSCSETHMGTPPSPRLRPRKS